MAGEQRGPYLSRRRFAQGAGVAGLGLLAGCGRRPGQAQPARVPRIGVLRSNPEQLGVTGAFPQDQEAAFVQGLRELGYAEGHNIHIERRYAEGVAELIQLPVDVILAAGTLAIRAAKDATDAIPIVMVIANDPVQQGFVASLARPGGNLTGLGDLGAQLQGKRLEVLKDTVPGLVRVAFLWNPAISDRAYERQETEAAAQALALRLHPLAARTPEELEAAFAAAATEPPEALLLQNSALISGHQARIAELAARSRLATMAGVPDFAANGGLMGYGPNRADQWRRAAYYVDKILRGTPPAELPVEQPMRIDFAINLKTAQALGLTIPQHVLLQATEIIQ